VREALLQLRSEGLVDIFAHPASSSALSKAESRRCSACALTRAPPRPKGRARPRLRTAPLPMRRCTRSMRAGRWRAVNAGISTVASSALVVPRLNPVTSEMLYRLHTLSQR